MDEPETVTLLDPDVAECPYDTYRWLRDEAPVYQDPRTNMWVISRFDDVRAVLLDTERFGSRIPRGRTDPRSSLQRQKYEEHGWVPGRTLAGRDDPEHKQMRALFDHAFRPSRIAELEPVIEDLAARLIAELVDRGEGDWVRGFAVPLPLIVIGMQMGAPEEDIWQIKAWTDAWVQRLGMFQDTDGFLWSTDMEIEAQHYFQPIFERLREEPDDSLLSDLVNTEIPEWGRCLTDEELHAEMMADTFVGGSETTTNALSEGARMLAEDRSLWARIEADVDGLLPKFIEEVLRLEGPVQGLFRVTRVDVELHGVTIPAGSMVNLRYAAANRDERRFECPDEMDLDRDNGRRHLAFGKGTHFCLGAPLARRELSIGFRALFDGCAGIEIAGDPELRHQPNFCLRALERLPLLYRRR